MTDRRIVPYGTLPYSLHYHILVVHAVLVFKCTHVYCMYQMYLFACAIPREVMML
jgi:hypothetical protein